MRLRREQRLHRARVTAARGDAQQRVAVRIHRVGIHAARQQRPDDVHAVVGDGLDQVVEQRLAERRY